MANGQAPTFCANMITRQLEKLPRSNSSEHKVQHICTMRKRRKGIFFSSLWNQEPAALGQSSEMQRAGLFLTNTDPTHSVQMRSTVQDCVQRQKQENIIVQDQQGGADKVLGEKSGKNGVWRRQQLSSIIPGSLALFSSEASLYLVVPECALWTINGAKAAHTRIHPAVLFLHDVILQITKAYRVVVALVACDITRQGGKFVLHQFQDPDIAIDTITFLLRLILLIQFLYDVPYMRCDQDPLKIEQRKSVQVNMDS